MATLTAFALTLCVIIIGDAAALVLELPVPGSVIGLVAAAMLFRMLGRPTPAMSRMFDAIIPYAPMLFVPAGAGVIANTDLIAAAWLPIASAITLGTAATLLVTGLCFQALLRLMDRVRSVP